MDKNPQNRREIKHMNDEISYNKNKGRIDYEQSSSSPIMPNKFNPNSRSKTHTE